MAGAGIGAGVGALTGLIGANQKKGQYNRDKQLAADMERNSPWTGVHGQMPTAPTDAFGSALQGGLSGAMMGQQFSPGGMFGGAAAPQAPASPMMGAQQLGGMPPQQMGNMAGMFEAPPSFYGQSSWASQKA